MRGGSMPGNQYVVPAGTPGGREHRRGSRAHSALGAVAKYRVADLARSGVANADFRISRVGSPPTLQNKTVARCTSAAGGSQEFATGLHGDKPGRDGPGAGYSVSAVQSGHAHGDTGEMT